MAPGEDNASVGLGAKGKLTIKAVTWNAHGKTPKQMGVDENLAKIFQTETKPDIFVVSLQEIVPLDVDHIFFDLAGDIDAKRIEWTAKIAKAVNEGLPAEKQYLVSSTRAVVGTYLLVLVKSLHKAHVSIREDLDINLQLAFFGLLSFGNKAAALHRLKIYGCTFCFVSVHLAAHRPNVNGRIEHVNYIIQETRFAQSQPVRLEEHDFGFFLGDTNFRILETLGAEEGYSLANEGRYSDLSKHDQLHDLQKKRIILSNWKEGELNFKPSYKLDLKAKAKGSYKVAENNLEKYVPAWTDRILYRSKHVDQCVSVQQYTSVELDTPVSDHYPVVGVFEIDVQQYLNIKKLDQEALAKFPGTSASDSFAEEGYTGGVFWCGGKRSSPGKLWK